MKALFLFLFAIKAHATYIDCDSTSQQVTRYGVYVDDVYKGAYLPVVHPDGTKSCHYNTKPILPGMHIIQMTWINKYDVYNLVSDKSLPLQYFQPDPPAAPTNLQIK